MASKRFVKSEIFMDETFIELEDMTRLVWLGLIIVVADDQGRFQDNPLLIKAQLFPADMKSTESMSESIDSLIKNGMLFRYTSNKKKLLQIVNWWKHQDPQWAVESCYPAPENWTDRVKYNGKGRVMIMKNWNETGGFNSVDKKTGEHLIPIPYSNTLSEHLIVYDNDNDNDNDNENDNENKKEVPAVLENVFKIYEGEIGLLTPSISDSLKTALEDYREDWIIEALKESAVQNKRSWKYALAILKRWKAQGHKSDSRSKGKVETNPEKFRRLYIEQNNKENNV